MFFDFKYRKHGVKNKRYKIYSNFLGTYIFKLTNLLNRPAPEKNTEVNTKKDFKSAENRLSTNRLSIKKKNEKALEKAKTELNKVLLTITGETDYK